MSPQTDPKKGLNQYGRYSGMAFQMMAVIAGGAFGGLKLDQWLDTRPVFTVSLSVLSVFLSIYFVTILSGIVALALFYLLPATWFSPALPVLFAFFYSCSLISFMILSNSIQKKFSRFTSMFMLTTAGKLFLFIAIMIIYSFLHKNDAVPFLLNFFVLYLIFTIFEVTRVVGLTKKPDTTGNEHA